MRADALPSLSPATIVCLQAGNVNTGAFDPAAEICAAARQAGAWVHVDGAFGLWAAAAPNRAYLTEGITAADSWATDAHKWLNVPYDSGLVFCRNSAYLQAAMSTSFRGKRENRPVSPLNSHGEHVVLKSGPHCGLWAEPVWRTSLNELVAMPNIWRMAYKRPVIEF
jgi:glutamate/tyrosine decarboxylase-like PLP-dependent enzyme